MKEINNNKDWGPMRLTAKVLKAFYLDAIIQSCHGQLLCICDVSGTVLCALAMQPQTNLTIISPSMKFISYRA